MRKIKSPRNVSVISAINNNLKTYRRLVRTNIPLRSARNLRHCHYLQGMRGINRTDKREWEQRVNKLLRDTEKHRLHFVNRFYLALERVQTLVEGDHRS